MTDFELLHHQQRFNVIINAWGKTSKAEFLRKIRTLPFKERKMWAGRTGQEILRGKVSIKFKKSGGDVVRVIWPFTRHGIFQERGVGRGRKIGSGKEKPMQWIKPVLESQSKILANDLADEAFRSLGNVIRINVNGIFSIEI
jgi:hypothetical protein